MSHRKITAGTVLWSDYCQYHSRSVNSGSVVLKKHKNGANVKCSQAKTFSLKLGKPAVFKNKNPITIMETI